MADDNGFNGQTLTFDPEGTDTAQALGPITNVTADIAASEVQVSGAGDTSHLFEAGLDNRTVTVDIIGTPTDQTASGTAIAVGVKGAVIATWATEDGGDTSGDITVGVLTNLTISGSLDGPITSSLTFKPSVTDL